jgi:parvulin-like peptidyl-prolyl isomerase
VARAITASRGFTLVLVAASALPAGIASGGEATRRAPGDDTRETGGAPAQVVARVNGEAVTRAEWLRLLTSPLERELLLEEPGVAGADPEALGRLALQKLIERRLLLQEGRRRGLTVTSQELDETIAALRRRFEDLEGFGRWMKGRGLEGTALFRSVRDDILVAKARGALAAEASVTGEDVQKYYDLHASELRTEEVWLQVIAVKERADGEEIQRALRKGEDFGRLARGRSLGVRASRGGDVGWVTAESLPPPVRDAVASLEPGEAIGPLAGDDHFLVVRLQERRAGRAKTLGEAQPEIEQRLLRLEQHQAIGGWLKQEQQKATIEVPGLEG